MKLLSIDNGNQYIRYQVLISVPVFYSPLQENCSLFQELIQKLLDIKNPDINLQLLTAELLLYLELELPRLGNENVYVSVLLRYYCFPSF